MVRKITLLALLLIVVVAFFAFELHRYLEIEAIKANYAALLDLYQRHPVTFILAFIAVQAGALALCIPGTLVSLAVVGGAIFGLWWGTLIVLVAVVIGDSLAFLIARYLLADWIRTRYAAQFARIDRGIARSGSLYLLAMRLIAGIPFFVVNLAMGLTKMPLSRFALVSFFGLIPATFLHVNVGTQLSRIRSISDVLSPGLILSFALLAIVPLGIAWAMRGRLDDQASSADNPVATAPIGPAIAPSPGGPTKASISSPENEP